MADASGDLWSICCALAQAWAEAVIGTSYVPLSAAELTALTHDLVDQLDAVLRSDPFTAEAAQAVGAAMVEAHFTNPRSLARTLEVLQGGPDLLNDQGPDFTQRWRQVVASLAEGYTQALTDRVLRDQQEMLAAALRARQDAENARWATERQLEQIREDFIATVTHELRTPLTPIKGYLSLLLSRPEAIGNDKRVELYRVMLSQADLLQHLLDDLLAAASGVAEAQFSVFPQKVDVVQVVKRALDGMDPASTRQFHWLGDDDVGWALCDPLRLRQVLANVLRNADLYATAGEPVHVSARRDTHRVEILVRDFGPGIPAEQADAVFEPFHRLGRGPTPGAGLGLHIARRLLEGMNGQIWHTDARPGACFHISLPLHEDHDR